MTEPKQARNHTTVIYECLSRPRRRYALHCLHEAEQPLALADLAEDVAECGADTVRSNIDDETVKDVHASLYHNHVQKLDDAGFVEYNQEQATVELLEYPEVLSKRDELLVSA